MDPIIHLDQIIEVIAIFKNNRCYPVKFLYQSKTIIIKELNLYHQSYHGQNVIHIFDVSNGQTDFRLEFNTQTLIWKLVALTNV
jgi:hypothetical protein